MMKVKSSQPQDHLQERVICLNSQVLGLTEPHNGKYDENITNNLTG
jgi:hypothetical protein